MTKQKCLIVVFILMAVPLISSHAESGEEKYTDLLNALAANTQALEKQLKASSEKPCRNDLLKQVSDAQAQFSACQERIREGEANAHKCDDVIKIHGQLINDVKDCLGK